MYLKMTRRMVGAHENSLQGTHSQYQHRVGPSANADQDVSDFAEESLQFSELLAFPVIKYTQGSRPAMSGYPQKWGTLTDARV